MRAVVDFIVRHPEHHRRHRRSTRGAACCCGRSSTCPTRRWTPRTCGSTRQIGKKGTELTGYPAISVFHEFRYHPKRSSAARSTGSTSTSASSAWVVEIWAPMREAGIDRLQVHRLVPRSSDRGRPEAVPLERREARRRRARRRGSRSTIRSSARVEIGGWNRFHAFGNPPPPLLETRDRAVPALARCGRRSSRRSSSSSHARADALGDGTWKRARWSCRTPAGCRAT